MGLRARFASWLLDEVKDMPPATPSGASMIAWTLPGPHRLKDSYQSYASDGYQKSATVFACINLRAHGLASLTWRFYEDETKEREIKRHPILDLLRHPNPMQSQNDFFQNVEGYFLLSGNSYVLAVGPTVGPPQELWTLRPDRVHPLPGAPSEPIAGYDYKPDGVTSHKPYTPEMIWHMRHFNPFSDLIGMAPLMAAAYAIDQNNEAHLWNLSMLRNQARPPGALVSDLPVSTDQYEQLQNMIAEEWGGSQNAGRPILLEGGLKWQEMAYSPAEMEWLQGLALSDRDIAKVLNVPSVLIGDVERSTYSNWQEARLALWQDTIIPRGCVVRDGLNHWLVPKFGGGYLDVDVTRIDALQQVRQQERERTNRTFLAGYITINDARREAGFEPDDSESGNLYVWQTKQPLAPGSGGMTRQPTGTQGGGDGGNTPVQPGRTTGDTHEDQGASQPGGFSETKPAQSDSSVGAEPNGNTSAAGQGDGNTDENDAGGKSSELFFPF